jgi:hypothetical protein
VHAPRPVPLRPQLGARAWAVLIPAGVLAFGLLVGVLVVLVGVKDQLTEQNQRTRLLIERADPTLRRAPGALDGAAPLLRDAEPLLAASRKALPQTRRAARDGQALLTATRPVVDDLGGVLTALRPLLADLGPAATDLRPVVASLRGGDLPGLLAGLTRGAQALPDLAGLAAEVRDRELLRRASRTHPTIGRIAQLQRAAVQVNGQTLTRTRSIEGMFRESLELQRQLLARTTSIDRRLGGTVLP